jgi:hypothetical protein
LKYSFSETTRSTCCPTARFTPVFATHTNVSPPHGAR